MDINNTQMYCHGKINFMVGIYEQLKILEIFNMRLEKILGKITNISYGIIA